MFSFLPACAFSCLPPAARRTPRRKGVFVHAENLIAFLRQCHIKCRAHFICGFDFNTGLPAVRIILSDNDCGVRIRNFETQRRVADIIAVSAALHR